MKLALSLLVMAAFGFSFSRGNIEGPEWLDDLDAAVALALESERPLLVVFR